MPWKPQTKTAHESGPEIVPAFAPVLSIDLEMFRNLPTQQNIARGQVLVEQGKLAPFVHLIAGGMVKLTHLNPDGDEQTIGLRSSGWYSGAISVLMNAPSAYSVQAITPCVAHAIPAEVFNVQLMQNAKIMKHFIRALCHELCSLAAAQVEIMSHSAADRLLRFLDERSMTGLTWKAIDPLPVLKKQELAQLLSISPEHLSRLLHKYGPCDDVPEVKLTG
jgi:CRP-like cAMP-binding protein